jgi:MFS family permease
MNIDTDKSRSLKYIPTIIVGVGAFIATFDITAVSLALPAIGRTFSLDVAGYVWIMDVYSLAFTITLITAGVVADRYGQRLTLIAGSVIFLAASTLCAYAAHFSVLIAGRALQGMGAAFVVCGGLAMTGRLYTERAERVQAFGIIGTVSGSALAIGPALGGLIANTFGWQWVFLINIPICLTIITGALRWMSEHKNRNDKRLDILGIVTVSTLLLIAIWFFLHGPIVGGIVFSKSTFVAIIVLLLVAFIWVETKAPYAAIDISLFKKRAFVGLTIVPLSLAVSYWSLIVFMPLFLASSLQVSNERISYMMLFFTMPMFVVPLLIANPRVARMAAEVKQSTYYFSGLFVVSLGCVAISFGSYFHEYSYAVAGMVIAGFGAAAMQSQVSGALIASAPQERAGGVSAITTVLRQGGFAIASAFLAKVMQAKIHLGPYSIENFTLLFFICALVAGVGSICTFFLTRTRADYATAAL